ncbi:MAG: GTP 3',8-cyclase MoaA [Thermoprotei archaeon]
MVLVDRYNRPLLGARISLNYSQFCNFACVFCHREGNSLTYNIESEADIRYAHEKSGGSQTLMSAAEIARIAKVLKSVGVVRFKLTGGEPMLRPDILRIVKDISTLEPLDFGMTTNATRLRVMADKLKDAGLQRVNISLHSLDKWRFKEITGVDRLADVLGAVERCVEVGLTPVKLNYVLLNGFNVDELGGFMDYASSFGGKVELQLIELVREGSAAEDGFFEKYYYSLNQVEKQLEAISVKKIIRSLQNRPRYLTNKGVWVELVRPTHNALFCANNDRIRVTPDGKFKPCLMRDDNLVDFLTPMRNGCTDEELKRLLFEANMKREPYFKRPKCAMVERGVSV